MKTSLVSLIVISLFGCSSKIEQSKQAALPLHENHLELTSTKEPTNESEQSAVDSKSEAIIRPENYKDCGLSEAARELAELIAIDSEQQRPVIVCDIKLAKLAQAKAEEMAQLGVVSHKGLYPSPNQRLIQSGVQLPDSETDLFNTVEAVMGGEEFADDVWLSFQTSYPHRTHLLADNQVFAKQESMGVGYYRKLQSPHVDYWVVYFANLSK